MKFNARGGDATSYTLGRGKLYLKGDTWFQGATPSLDGWRDVGNVTNFTVTQESETKEHKNFLSGVQTIDLNIAVSRKLTLSFTSDELNVQNLAKFFSGTLYSKYLDTNVPNMAAIASDSALIAAGDRNFFYDSATSDYLFDLWFDLQLNYPIYGIVRAYDFEPQAAQAITVTKQAANRTTPGTALTEGTHYEIDRKMGRIRFFENVAGGIARGDTFLVTWATPTDVNKLTTGVGIGFDVQLHRIGILENSGVEVALKFIAENPNDGDKQTEFEFFKVKLSPDGEFSAIGDDWAGLSFTGVASTIPNPPAQASPYGRITTRSLSST